MNVRGQVAAILVAAAMTGHAGAAQPLLTEDADIKPARACEWESSWSRSRAHDDEAMSALTTQLGCGIGFNSELRANVSRTQGAQATNPSWAFGGKTAIHARNDNLPTGLAVAWSTLIDRASGGSQALHLYSANAVVSRAIGAEWTLHANLGLAHDRLARRTDITWALAAEHALNSAFDVSFEALGAGRETLVAGGLRWSAGKSVVLGASLAHGCRYPFANTGAFTATFAF